MILKRTDRCALRLGPGEYKRVPARGKVIGHYIRCPACGYRAMVVLSFENPGDSGGVDPETNQIVGGLTLDNPIKCPAPLCKLIATVKNDVVTRC